MERLQVDEIGKDTRVCLVSSNVQLVVVQDERFHIAHPVVRFALDFLNVVVGHVNNLQTWVVVHLSKNIPRHTGDIVACTKEEECKGLWYDSSK